MSFEEVPKRQELAPSPEPRDQLDHTTAAACQADTGCKRKELTTTKKHGQASLFRFPQ